MNPIRIFEGSFGGPTLFQNPHYVSPNDVSRTLLLYATKMLLKNMYLIGTINMGMNVYWQSFNLFVPIWFLYFTVSVSIVMKEVTCIYAMIKNKIRKDGTSVSY